MQTRKYDVADTIPKKEWPNIIYNSCNQIKTIRRDYYTIDNLAIASPCYEFYYAVTNLQFILDKLLFDIYILLLLLLMLENAYAD